MRIKIIDTYIIKEFLYVLTGLLFIVSIVLSVYVLIESIGDIVDNKPGMWHIVLFFFFSLPFLLFQTIPMVVAMATVYSIGSLSRKKEILVMITSGVSPLRLALPLLILGILFSVGAFFFNELIVPYSEEKARFIGKVYIEGKSENIITKNKDIFLKGKGNRFYLMKDFDSKNNIMSKPIIIDVDANGGFINQRIEAEKAELVKIENKQNAWKFTGYVRHVYDKYGKLINIEQSKDSILIPMEEDLEKFLSNRKKAEEMNYSELRTYLSILKKRGESNPDLETDLHLKLAFPFASFIVILIGFCFAIKAHFQTLIYSLGKGIGIIVLYYASIIFLQGLGHHGIINPLAASWAPNLIFTLLGGYFLYREVV